MSVLGVIEWQRYLNSTGMSARMEKSIKTAAIKRS